MNALDSALRSALVGFFPQLKQVRLIDYKVRILESAVREALRNIKDSFPADHKLRTSVNEGLVTIVGTAAKIRVLVESTDGHDQWGTVGVSTNIVEASLQALIESMEYRLLEEA